MLERDNENWEQDIEWVMASITIGQGFKSGGGGGFPLLPYHPDTDASRAFLLAYSRIEVEDAWPGAD